MSTSEAEDQSTVSGINSGDRDVIHAAAADAGLLSEDDGEFVRIFTRSGHSKAVDSLQRADDYLIGLLHGSKYRLWLDQQGITTGQDFREWVQGNFTKTDLQTEALQAMPHDRAISDQEAELTLQNSIKIILKQPDADGNHMFDSLEGYDGCLLEPDGSTLSTEGQRVIWDIPLDALLRALGEVT